MKKPKILKLLAFVRSEKNGWKDWNGKPSKDYLIEIPEWLARAYNLDMRSVVVTIFAEKKSMKQMRKITTNTMPYFKANWLKKCLRARRLNKNYIKIEVIKPSKKLEGLK